MIVGGEWIKTGRRWTHTSGAYVERWFGVWVGWRRGRPIVSAENLADVQRMVLA